MNSSSIDILLVEDNRHDEMLTMHALRNCQLAASVFIVRDGAEALDFLFCDGQFAKRPA